jgi:nitrile hydratase subunit beta
MAGMHGFGAVLTAGSERTHDEPWEVRAQFVGLMSKASGGSMRRHIEALPAAEYLASSYYARWLAAAENLHVNDGSLTHDDLSRWRAHFEAEPEATVPRRDDPALRERVEARLTAGRPLPPAELPRFSMGDAVTVARMHPPHHHRCPRYVRGVRGVIEQVCGQDEVPTDARGSDGSAPVYTVRFSSRDLWGRTDEPPFTVLVDLWQGYLEAAT